MSRKAWISAIFPARASRTWSAQGAWPPAGSGRYWPNAMVPDAATGISREFAHSAPGPSIQAAMSAGPSSHMANGGIDWTASAASSATSASMS